MNEQSKYIPNSFQTPNAQVDDLMYLLSGDEYKLLSFATRHILGWQDTIVNRRAKISLSMFQNGFKTRNGTWYGGCGLSRGAIINNLSELIAYNLLTPVGEPTNSGQEYELSANPDVDGLQKRYEDQKNANKKRTSKARKKLQEQGGQSDNTGKSDNTTSGQSDNTATDNVALTSGGQSDNTQLNTSLNQQTQEQSAPSATPSPDWKPAQWMLSDVLEYKSLMPDKRVRDKQMYPLIAKALFSAYVRGCTDGGLTMAGLQSMYAKYKGAYPELVTNGVTPYQVYRYYKHVCETDDKVKCGEFIPSLESRITHILNWQPTQANGANTPVPSYFERL